LRPDRDLVVARGVDHAHITKLSKRVDYDDDPSIALETLFEWFAAIYVGVRGQRPKREPPPEGLVARALARHPRDATRLFVEHWAMTARRGRACTAGERADASILRERLLILVFHAESIGALSENDRDRLQCFRALEHALDADVLLGAPSARRTRPS
jgi:hypothetical protein